MAAATRRPSSEEARQVSVWRGSPTCPGVNGEEALWISAGDPVAEPVAGLGVGIDGVYLDDGHVLGGVLHDGGVVDGLRRLRRVVVDVLHLDVDLDEGRERHYAAVHGVDREPVVRRRLVVQQLLCPDDAWEGEKEVARVRKHSRAQHAPMVSYRAP